MHGISCFEAVPASLGQSMATRGERSMPDSVTTAGHSHYTSATKAGEVRKSECGARASPDPFMPAGCGLDADAIASVDADAAMCPAAGAACTETASNCLKSAADCGRRTGADCPAAAAGVITKEGTEELRPGRSWKRRVNKNRANTFTFKLVSASCGDPCTAGNEGASGGHRRALQRVVPPNALRKNKYAKQLPRALLENFAPEDFGIHANLDPDVRRQLCDEIYGEAADLLEGKWQQPHSSKQQEEIKQQEDASTQPQEASRPFSSHSFDLDDDCYFPKDGYDYTQHLVPIRGQVYSTTNKPQATAKSTTHSQEQETQQAPKPPTASALCREECHVLEALENADDYEELLDDFVATAQTDETGQVQPIEGEEALLWGESHVTGTGQQGDAICERLAALRLQEPRERRLDEDDYWTESSNGTHSDDSDVDDAAADAVEDHEGDDDDDGTRKARAAAPGGNKKQAAAGFATVLTDEDFEKVLEEYGDEYIGEVELEDKEAGSTEREGEKMSSEVEEALDDFLRQHKRGKKLHIFTKDFLMRRSTRRLPTQASAAAAIVAGERQSSSHRQQQPQESRGYRRRCSKSGDEEAAKGDKSGSEAGNGSDDEKEAASADKEERHGKQHLSHTKGTETDIQEMFRQLSKADVEAIKRLIAQQERESQQRMERGEEDYYADEEMRERRRREQERRWDCETILTTRTTSSWIPRTIALPPPHILKKQLHLLRGVSAARGSTQGDESGSVKLLQQLIFAEDVTSAAAPAAASSGSCGFTNQERQQQEATMTKKSLRGKGKQRGMEAPNSHLLCDDEAEDRGSTSGSSTAGATPPPAANDRARLVEALKSAPEADVTYVVTHRPRGETTEERRERKKAVKETQRLAREVKKQNKLLLKEEEKKAAGRRMKSNAYDLKAGVRCVKL